MPRLPSNLSQELATVRSNPLIPVYGGNRLYPQDETLLSRGGGSSLAYDIYSDIAKDGHAYSVLQKRYMAVIGREWEVKPASKDAIDVKAADLVKAQLESLSSRSQFEENGEAILTTGGGFDHTCFDLLSAILYGFAPAEIMWDQDGSEIYPAEIRSKDLRRFAFVAGERGYKLRLLTFENAFDGVPVPPRKFIVHRFASLPTEDPYGLGMGTRLFYPVYFKRNSVKFWLVFNDKWASPTAVGRYPRNATPEQRDRLLQMLGAIATDSGIIIPEDMQVEFLEAQRSGTVSTYKDLVDFCDGEVSKAVLGETGTTDQRGSGGSRARDQVGNEVRIEVAKADADLLSETLNRTLIPWIVGLNLPDAKPPKVWRKFPELEDKFDRSGEASIVSMLTQAGFKPTTKWVAERFEIEIEEQPPEAEQPDPDAEPDLVGLLNDSGTESETPEETPLEPTDQPPELSEAVEFRATTGTKKTQRNCTKGFSCGSTCIAKGRQCKSQLQSSSKSYADYLEAQIKQLQSQLAAATAPTLPKPGSVAEVDPKDIFVDPKRFQYKLLGEHTATGEVGSLSGVKKFDPNLAGVIQVWIDPADGKPYVVNGHNRLALANKLGAEKVTVRYLDVRDAQEARAVGALTNVSEGHGTALDAAKFFKDSGLTKDDLDRKGIPMREKIATDGIALSKLEDSLFRKVIDGDLPTERAVIVGGSGLDHDQQRSLFKLVDEQSKKRKITNEVLGELVDTVKASQQQTTTQFDLFGASQVVVDNALERATLQAAIKKRLGREKKLFGTVGKSTAAQQLAQAGNVIDVSSSQKVSKDASAALSVFDQLKNQSGGISRAINDAANQIEQGRDRKKVESDLYKQILGLVQSGNFSESIDFARLKLAGNTKQTKQCKKGYSCGFSCISKSKECRSPLKGQAKTYADWLSSQIKPQTAHKPFMTETEAIDYCKDSVYRDRIFFHGTSKAGAASITTDGVDIDKNEAALFGKGFYVAGNGQKSAWQMSEGVTGWAIARNYVARGGEILEMRINAKNPLVTNNFSDWMDLIGKQQKLGALPEGPEPPLKQNPSYKGQLDYDDPQYIAARDKFRDTFPTYVQQWVKSQGYDAIEVRDNQYLVLFDPSQVAVYGRHKNGNPPKDVKAKIEAEQTKLGVTYDSSYNHLKWRGS